MKYIKKYNELNEGVGDEKSILLKLISIFLAPISIPIFINLSTETKIKHIKKCVLKNYIEERAEYKILDEIKYDVDQPSKLKKIRNRLKLIKRNDKYPTIESYITGYQKVFKILNILNFRNKVDTDYIFEKIREYYSLHTDDEWTKISYDYLVYDEEKGKVREKSSAEFWNENPHWQERIDALRHQNLRHN